MHMGQYALAGLLAVFASPPADSGAVERDPAAAPHVLKRPILIASRAGGDPRCSSAALPADERRRMQAEYARRLLRDGRASADAWAREQGRLFRASLEAEGICPPTADSARPSTQNRSRSARRPTGKDGKPCERTRVEQRVTPGFGGAPMSMGMVVVCAD